MSSTRRRATTTTTKAAPEVFQDVDIDSSQGTAQTQRSATVPTPSTSKSPIRLYIKALLGLVSIACFALALLPLLQKGQQGAIDFSENVVASLLPSPLAKKGKARISTYKSPIPFQLESRHSSETVVRSADTQKQAAVKEAFLDSWNAYVEDAFGSDEYHPISQTGSNFSVDGGVGYFVIDTLDVLLIMGEEAEFRRARDWVQKVDWSNRRGKFSVFETTIRTLGGLLSAHALCQAGKDSLSPRTSQICSSEDSLMFLEKAVGLAKRLSPAFESSQLGIPLREVDFQSGKAFADTDNQGMSSLAEVASIQLEFKYLAHATGDERWWTLAEKPMRSIRKASLKARSEGILPIFMDPNTGNFYLSSIRLGSRGDSYYEYLIKQYVQTNHIEKVYASMYQEAMTGIKSKLLRQSLQEKLLYTFEIEPRYNPQDRNRPNFVPVPKQDHLVCFLGGSYMLGAAHTFGGKEYHTASEEEEEEKEDQLSINRFGSKISAPLSSIRNLPPQAQEDFTVGHELIKTCVETYKGTSTGLAAEITMFRTVDDSYPGPEKDWYIKKGPKKGGKSYAPLIDGRNILRPETVESLFIAFHLTGDVIYRNWGWEIFQSFIKSTKIKKGEKKGRIGAFSSIIDVQAQSGAIEREDRMETFWLSETLKYLYLLFSDQEILRLDQWVLNTEAHPLPIFDPKFKTTVFL